MNFIFNRLKNLRESKNYKQTYVASFLNITQQSYSRYENGQRELPIHLLPLLVKLYGVSADYILGISTNASDYNTLSQNTYEGRALNEFINELGYLNEENKKLLITYIEFLKYKQNLRK